LTATAGGGGTAEVRPVSAFDFVGETSLRKRLGANLACVSIFKVKAPLATSTRAGTTGFATLTESPPEGVPDVGADDMGDCGLLTPVGAAIRC
jgi:hypothetical protein